jgi:hypothetical protein
MGNITLSIPDDVHAQMKRFSEVRWSEVARRAIIDKIETLSLAEELANKSELSKRDVERFSKRIKSLAGKRARP